ncbi:MAG: hypothetical protein IH899_16425 [Planctomycetes bacterium]|nr:hypothetical protein [Planctomycetota bacterium]
MKLPKTKSSLTIPLPDEFHTSNVLVELIGSGQRKSQAYYSHSLTVQTIENYGQLRVTEGKTSEAVML